ncbi:hypothetical protein KI387_013440, partial [Taxus chinensis]
MLFPSVPSSPLRARARGRGAPAARRSAARALRFAAVRPFPALGVPSGTAAL